MPEREHEEPCPTGRTFKKGCIVHTPYRGSNARVTGCDLASHLPQSHRLVTELATTKFNFKALQTWPPVPERITINSVIFI